MGVIGVIGVIGVFGVFGVIEIIGVFGVIGVIKIIGVFGVLGVQRHRAQHGPMRGNRHDASPPRLPARASSVHIRARTMPRRQRVDDGEHEWNQVVHELVNMAADAITAHEPSRAVADVQDDEIQARGKVALRALNAREHGAHAGMPVQWDWGTNRWIRPVRQELARRVKRQSDEEAAAFLAALPRQQIPPRDATARTYERFRDVEDGKHPGWELFEDFFDDEEVARLLELKTQVQPNDWEHLFNDVCIEPTARQLENMRAKMREMLKGDASYRDMINTLSPWKRTGWSATSWTMSAFRQQARVGTEEVELFVLERLKSILPENAVFPPPGKRLYMLRNVRDAPRTASRGEQPMHSDWHLGLKNRLGVIISLHDDVYLAVGDRWSEDVSKVCARVRIPKGAVFVFANTVPHAGMGDVAKDGVERLHMYVGLDCAPEDVHPTNKKGNLETFFAILGNAPRMKIAKRKRLSQ